MNPLPIGKSTPCDYDYNKRFDPLVRAEYLGGTDAAKVARQNRFENGKPYFVWQEKTGRKDPVDLSDPIEHEAVFWGKKLEEDIAQVYAERSGNRVRKVNRTLVHPKYSYIRGHIDRKLENAPAGLECKTVGFRSVHEWGEPGTDEIPIHYELQLLHYLAITGYNFFDVACLVGGQELRIYTVSREGNESRIDELIEMEVRFWEDHVLTDIPPVPPSTDEALAAYPDAQKGKVAFLRDDQKFLLTTCHNLASELDRVKQSYDAAKSQLQNTIGDAELLEDMQGFEVASWKSSTRHGFDSKRAVKERPDLLDEFPSVSNYRTFRIKKRREENE